MRLLVTGASGVIGRELVPRLQEGGADVVLLTRRPLADDSRLWIRGDIERPGLGIDSPEALHESITGIVHCAARTEFSIGENEAERANVTATDHVLNFGARCARLDRVVLLSTVYVAGKRTGRITGKELQHDAGFVNEYERSKYRMEERAEEWRTKLPVGIVRTSTIIGHSDGTVSRFDAIHRALGLYFRGLIPMVPGTPDSPVDVVTSDAAAAAIAEFVLTKFRSATIQCAAGESAPPLERFLELLHQSFAEADAGWPRRSVEKPAIVSLETFAALEETVRISRDPFFAEVLRTMHHFVPQLAYPKTFLPDFQAQAASELKAIVRRIVKFCVQRNFR